MRFESSSLLAVLLVVGPASAQIAVTSNDNKVNLVNGVVKIVADPKPDTVTILDLKASPPSVQRRHHARRGAGAGDVLAEGRSRRSNEDDSRQPPLGHRPARQTARRDREARNRQGAVGSLDQPPGHSRARGQPQWGLDLHLHHRGKDGRAGRDARPRRREVRRQPRRHLAGRAPRARDPRRRRPHLGPFHRREQGRVHEAGRLRRAPALRRRHRQGREDRRGREHLPQPW